MPSRGICLLLLSFEKDSHRLQRISAPTRPLGPFLWDLLRECSETRLLLFRVLVERTGFLAMCTGWFFFLKVKTRLFEGKNEEMVLC